MRLPLQLRGMMKKYALPIIMAIAISIVSLTLLIPSLFDKRIWKYQNRFVDWCFDHLFDTDEKL